MGLDKVFSIHASAKEATDAYKQFQAQMQVFNPRLREGGDVADALALGRDNFSIHASAKEATITLGAGTTQYVFFNPRLREGGDSPLML